MSLVYVLVWSPPPHIPYITSPNRQHMPMLSQNADAIATWFAVVKKGKGFPYSTPSVGPGADPGVQAVSPQMTVSHTPGGRLPLLSARPAVTSPATELVSWSLTSLFSTNMAISETISHRASPPFGRYQVVLLGDRGTSSVPILSLNSLHGTVSFTLTLHIHLTILISTR